MIRIRYEVAFNTTNRILIFEHIESNRNIVCNAEHHFSKQELLEIIEKLEPCEVK